jgi:hypothetical protein
MVEAVYIQHVVYFIIQLGRSHHGEERVLGRVRIPQYSYT